MDIGSALDFGWYSSLFSSRLSYLRLVESGGWSSDFSHRSLLSSDDSTLAGRIPSSSNIIKDG